MDSKFKKMQLEQLKRALEDAQNACKWYCYLIGIIEQDLDKNGGVYGESKVGD